jgi:ParB family chromosome partitioning protein
VIRDSSVTGTPNNKAWRSAEAVRREFLSTLLARKTPPKSASGYVAAELAHGSHAMRKTMERSPELAATLLVADEAIAWASVAALAAQATDGRAQVITLALVLAGHEPLTY